ncbi:MAG: 2-oxo acid dehydrogenase subunit E2 [Alphaproteobacteria bacterium]|nr:2-oxo acid dehydrogenase subunit E2 [Alphaproteobacteria bacterium]
MSPAIAIAGTVLVLLVVWILLELRTGRPDGTFRKVHPFRLMMFHIMPTRNESVVYFDYAVRAEKLEAWLEKVHAHDVHITHATVAAVNIGLAENPRMNQFVMGRRMYDRKGRWITFSMKRKKLDKQAKLSAVKLQMKDGETLGGLVERINSNIIVERSGDKTAADKEFDLFKLLPRPLLMRAPALLRWLDHYNLLPGFFIEGDGMYTSVFIANLGSLQMGAGYHHLYEWGTCPLFLMFGQTETRPVVDGDRCVPGRVLPVRFSYDERIDDGLTARDGIRSVVRVLEDPERWLGLPDADGNWSRPMWPHPEGMGPGDA